MNGSFHLLLSSFDSNREENASDGVADDGEYRMYWGEMAVRDTFVFF